ncbi:MAG TPA: tetratricopeptide repeat protein [Mycobacteriales bacterium]|nr:tetratricopeptide repeat protein [Mycobacteriales bacterium]
MPRRRSIVLLVAMVTVLAGCSGGGSGSGSGGDGGDAGGSSRAQASEALAAGLKAQKAGKIADAKVLYARVLSLEPTNVYAHFDLGVIAQQQGDVTVALSNYAAALSFNAMFTPAMYNEAILYTATNPELAMSLYRQVLVLKPDDADSALNLGLLEASHGQRHAAQQHLQLAINENPALAGRIPNKTAAKAQLTPSAQPTSTP